MEWRPNNLIVKGALAAFHERLGQIPTIYQKHCQTVASTTATETYAWPGMAPVPREFINGRSIQGLRDFTYNVTNNEYELSLAISRKHFEDDQTGLIAARMREMAEVWGTYKDYLFATLVEAGASGTAYDAVTFYNASRTIGDSGTIDNINTSAAATGTTPTAAEFLDALGDAKTQLRGFNDDQGRPFNTLAATQLGVIVPASFERSGMEALNSSFIIGDDTAGGSKDNVFKGMASMDVCDYLTSAAVMHVTALGSERKPFIYQERTPLEVVILDSVDDVAYQNSVLVLCRQRFVITYGEPRRAIQHTFT